MFLSIIVPVYNGEAYLEGLTNSLYSQNFPEDEFEIIFVDDCSSDNSKDKLYKISSEHPNVKIVCHTSNKGVATTCNDGVNAAAGKYFWIIGQDDDVSPKSLMILHQETRNAPDIVLFNYQHLNANGDTDEEDLIFHTLTGRGQDIINDFGDSFHYYLLGYEWRAIFKKSFTNKIGLRFPDGQRFEDTTYLVKALFYSNNVRTIKDSLYFYKERRGSIMNQLTFSKDGELIYDFAFINGLEVEDFARKIKNSNAHISAILNKKASWYYNSFRKDLLLTSKGNKIKFFKRIKTNQPECLERLTIVNRLIISKPRIGYFITLIISPEYQLYRHIKNTIRK